MQGYTPPQYAGPNLTRGHTITAAGDCSSTSCEPKVGVAAIEGDPDEQHNSITVGITSKVVTLSESMKRIEWTQTESNNIDISISEGDILSNLHNDYASDDHIFEINLPNVPGTGHSCNQIVQSHCTAEEVGDGAACSL
jgi:hypothetical protein